MIRFARFYNQLTMAKLAVNLGHQRPADILGISGIECLFVEVLNDIVVQGLYLMDTKESLANFYPDF